MTTNEKCRRLGKSRSYMVWGRNCYPSCIKPRMSVLLFINERERERERERESIAFQVVINIANRFRSMVPSIHLGAFSSLLYFLHHFFLQYYTFCITSSYNIN